MSRFRPDRLYATLAPGQLVLARTAGGSEVFPLQGGSEDAGTVLPQLELAFDKFATRKGRLRLMLGGAYARYALTAPVGALLSEVEEDALARQAIRQHLGDATEGWTVRYRIQERGQPFLACAVETALIDGIQSLCAKRGIRVDSIQPLLAWAYAQSARAPRRDGWLAVVEPGWLHLILLQGWAWMHLASVRTFGGWEDELDILLRREAVLHGQDHEAPLRLVSAIPGLSCPARFPSWQLLPAASAKSDTPYLDLALGMS